MVVEPINKGAEYAADDEVGSEPSVVYLMVAPSVLELITTF